jgi:hypothetical protein
MSAALQVHFVEDLEIETISHDQWGVVRMTIKTRSGSTSIDLYVDADFDKNITVTTREKANEA